MLHRLTQVQEDKQPLNPPQRVTLKLIFTGNLAVSMGAGPSTQISVPAINGSIPYKIIFGLFASFRPCLCSLPSPGTGGRRKRTPRGYRLPRHKFLCPWVVCPSLLACPVSSRQRKGGVAKRSRYMEQAATFHISTKSHFYNTAGLLVYNMVSTDFPSKSIWPSDSVVPTRSRANQAGWYSRKLLSRVRSATNAKS